MRPIIAAIHGILTNQTDPSWPDKFDAWMARRDLEVKVLKKEYAAGPFPRWNCWVKDPRLARSLANEIELFLAPDSSAPKVFGAESPTSSRLPAPACSADGQSGSDQPINNSPPIWFVAHSNGAVIALLAAKRLIERGHRIGGLILTGAAVEADLAKNGVLNWLENGNLRTAIAYSSADDEVLNGLSQPLSDTPIPPHPVTRFLQFTWRKLMWPYGCLGRTGWLLKGQPLDPLAFNPQPSSFKLIRTRWFPGGHSTYFAPQNIESTFEQIYEDVSQSHSEQPGFVRSARL